VSPGVSGRDLPPTERELEAWRRVFRQGYDARLLRCRSCGADSCDANEVLFEMLVFDPAPRARRKHSCARCGAPMPWCDERRYGKVAR